MDYEQGSLSYRGMSRLSRLPRATASTIPDIHQDETTKPSGVAKTLTAGSLKVKLARPLTENNNTTIRSGFGFGGQSLRNRNRPPVVTHASASHDSTLDVIAPGINQPSSLYENSDENAITYGTVKGNQSIITVDVPKRKHRPSLSERTIETMSQLPLSPSPTRNRSNTASSTGSIGRSLQASSPSRNQFIKPNNSRLSSPRKSVPRPSGAYNSPVKDIPPVPSFDKIYTPPKALVKDQGSRIARLSRVSQRSSTAAVDDDYLVQFQQPRQRVPQSHKVKSMYNLRGAAAKSSASKPAIASMFQDPPKTPAVCRKLQLAGMDRNNTLLKPKSPGQNMLATSPKNVTKQAQTSKETTKIEKEAEGIDNVTEPCAKSSLALRETIARAKAAKRQEIISQKSSQLDGSHQSAHQEVINDSLVRTSALSFKMRLQSAVTTGVLNVAAQGLNQMPNEILTMYDFDENSHVDWSEAVDMTKLIMANNELTALSDEAFPDWTMEELAEDDEKSNIFAALEVLDLRGNQLTELPIGLRRLERLHTLNLSNNKLTNDALDVLSQIPNLRELIVASNDFTGLLPANICQLEQLHTLDLRDNKITEIPIDISMLQALQRLNISGNKLSCLPALNMMSLPLSELDVSNNKLTGTILPSEGLQKLRRLDISVNRIDLLCEGRLSMPHLQILMADNNCLKNLPDLSALSELTTLSVSHNQLESLPQGFTSLQSLRNANLSGNEIKTIDASVSTLENLVSLNMAGNPLRERKYITMNAEDIRIDLAKRMEVIDTSEGHASSGSPDEPAGESDSTISSKQPYLFHPINGVLNLSSLSLTTVNPDLIDLTKPVHTIRLSNNDLTSFPTALLSHPNVKYTLKSLDISHNPSLHPRSYLSESISLPVLQSLFIVSTGLESLDTLTTHISAPELKELNISCHKLTGHVPWVKAWFPSLTTLLATDNWFTSVDTEAVRGLEVLDVRNNDIEALPPKIGELGNVAEGKCESGRLRAFECTGNRFRIPRLAVLEKGTEATLRDLRRMVPLEAVGEEWR